MGGGFLVGGWGLWVVGGDEKKKKKRNKWWIKKIKSIVLAIYIYLNKLVKKIKYLILNIL